MLVAHKLAFDLSFLAMRPDAPDELVRPASWLCTMRLLAGAERLDAFVGRFGVTISDRHTAVGDALALGRALASMSLRAGREQDAELGALIAALRGRSAEGRDTRPKDGDRDGWWRVRADLDHVVPIEPVSRHQRDVFRAVTRLVEDVSCGPAHLVDHDACVATLRSAHVTASALDLLLTELP